MASSSKADLVVATAALTAALIRADPRSCTRNENEDAIDLLVLTTLRCSPSNVQKCKQWALQHLIPSSGRLTAFGKFLVALSASFAPDERGGNGDERQPRSVPPPLRRRLFVLYILHDIIHHVKFKAGDQSFASKLEPFLPQLVLSASATGPKRQKRLDKVRDLITLWEDNEHFDPQFVRVLREVLETGFLPGDGEKGKDDDVKLDKDIVKVASKLSRTAPLRLPAMHGDAGMAWYDLPAGNWMRLLERRATRPMRPADVKPLQLVPGPAEKKLIDAVEKLLVDVDRIYGGALFSNDPNMDIGPMGEYIELDELSGDIIGGETYYGWSMRFCRNMKARRKTHHGTYGGRNKLFRGRSDSRSFTSSRSRSESRGRYLNERARSLYRGSRSSSSRSALDRRRGSNSPRRKRRRSTSTQESRQCSRRRRDYHVSEVRSRSSDFSRTRSKSRRRSRSRSRDGHSSYSTASERKDSPARDESPEYSPPPAFLSAAAPPATQAAAPQGLVHHPLNQHPPNQPPSFWPFPSNALAGHLPSLPGFPGNLPIPTPPLNFQASAWPQPPQASPVPPFLGGPNFQQPSPFQPQQSLNQITGGWPAPPHPQGLYPPANNGATIFQFPQDGSGAADRLGEGYIGGRGYRGWSRGGREHGQGRGHL